MRNPDAGAVRSGFFEIGDAPDAGGTLPGGRVARVAKNLRMRAGP